MSEASVIARPSAAKGKCKRSLAVIPSEARNLALVANQEHKFSAEFTLSETQGSFATLRMTANGLRMTVA